MPGVDGTGVTVRFTTSLIELELIDTVEISGQTRDAINTTSHSSAGDFMTFTPALFVDGGTITLPFQWTPNDSAGIQALAYAAAETITVRFPDAGAVAFTGFVTEVSFSNPFRDRCTGSLTIKVAADPSWTSSIAAF